MRKIFSTFLVLGAFIGFLLIPIGVNMHVSMMQKHHANHNLCLEHCVSGIDYFSIGSISNVFEKLSEIFITKTIFQIFTFFVLPLTSLYILILYAPPNIRRKIKNYAYSELRGIVIATT